MHGKTQPFGLGNKAVTVVVVVPVTVAATETAAAGEKQVVVGDAQEGED